MSTENYSQIEAIALDDVEVLKKKGLHYGRSWLKRGGVGAFMMLARKWDRIENDAARRDYNILDAISKSSTGVDGLLDDIGDLRRYLLLVESEYRDSLSKDVPPTDECGPKIASTLTGSLESRGERMEKAIRNGDGIIIK